LKKLSYEILAGCYSLDNLVQSINIVYNWNNYDSPIIKIAVSEWEWIFKDGHTSSIRFNIWRLIVNYIKSRVNISQGCQIWAAQPAWADAYHNLQGREYFKRRACLGLFLIVYYQWKPIIYLPIAIFGAFLHA